MLDAMRKNGLRLAIFAAVTTGLTAVVNTVTKPTIRHQAQLQQQALFDQVLPGDRYDNDLQHACYVVTDPALGNAAPHRLWLATRQQHPVAAVVESTAPDGYSGNIQLLVAADFSGKVLGTRVTEHHETPGLGDKIETRVSDWILTLTGRHIAGAQDPRFAVRKDGGTIDQFTGATITPRAVVNAVKRTTLFIGTLPPRLSSLPECGDTHE
ncbi:electron transport complex subunit RsxG [Pantoea sp. 1.19]|uniref:electron transport complex subunit RsxG n=1 Tax=Pantoea sp. 1.19 TaxID=1925589 RepID=UPI000948F192|nr:electron transport complex subunit RsxG [Pantoea sp. 1.19]